MYNALLPAVANTNAQQWVVAPPPPNWVANTTETLANLYLLPPANIVASGIERSRIMAIVPTNGPMASMANAQPQPEESLIIGSSQIVTAVNANPIPVWKVSIVPRYTGSLSSVIAVENCAESATTAAPHIITRTTINTIKTVESGERKPTNDAMPPLTTMAMLAVAVRPIFSDQTPA